MKTCSQCGQEKQVGEFRKNIGTSDGRRSECAECSKERDKKRPKRKRYDGKKRDRREYAKQYRKENKDKTKKYRKQVRLSGAAAAHQAVRYAIYSGKLYHAHECDCFDCGAKAEEYHHYKGYEKSGWLNVVPLCRMCHKARHKD